MVSLTIPTARGRGFSPGVRPVSFRIAWYMFFSLCVQGFRLRENRGGGFIDLERVPRDDQVATHSRVDGVDLVHGLETANVEAVHHRRRESLDQANQHGATPP